MPFIRTHSVDETLVTKISGNLKKELALALRMPEESWVIEALQTKFFDRGAVVSSSPFIDVIWMQRSQEDQDLCARVIVKVLKDALEGDVFVLFHNVAKETFYKNGIHF